MTDSRTVLRVLHLERGRIRTLLLVAACVFGRPTWTSVAVAYALVLPGAALHLAAKGSLRFDGLSTGGPYRWVRNPFYLATLIVDAGICVVAGDPWLAAAAMSVSLAVHLLTIRREEGALAALFGATYADYRSRVPRLLPWRGPVGGLPPSRGFSWTNPQLVAGVEYARLVRTIEAPLVVVVGSALLRFGSSVLEPAHRDELCAAATLAALFALERLLVLRSRRMKAARPEAQSAE